MTTLADMTLEVAKAILDVVESTAETGSTGTILIDTAGLQENNAYYDGGTVWFRSGANSGQLRVITTHKSGTLNWTAALGFSPTAGDRYAVARRLLPYRQLRQAINSAFSAEGSFILDENLSLTGDGQTFVFTLPAGVSKVEHVEVVPATGSRTPDFHHRERIGKLYFDTAPQGALALQFRKRHTDLVDPTDTINTDINTDWLKWKAVEGVLRWGYRFLQNDPVLKIDVFLNETLDKLKTLRPRYSVSVSARVGG